MSLGIILIGATGRMGREIASLAIDDSTLSLTGAIEYEQHPNLGKDYGLCLGKDPLDVPLSSTLEDITSTTSVIIDFSSPDSLRKHLPLAAEKNIPVVIGTTGLSESDTSYAASFSSRLPLLVSPNMSLGVNLLFYLTDLVSKRLKDNFDIEIIEAHHRFKKDAPSGTAKRIGEIVSKNIGLSYKECIKDGRQGITTTDRSRTEVGMHAVRGGDIVGDHTVLFAGIGERVELRHMAHSRSTFSKGALVAAKWLSNQNNGLYSMREVLDL